MEHTNRSAQYWISIIVSLASFAASISINWTTPVLPKFHSNETDIHLSDEQQSWLVSVTAPGMMAGCFAAQFIHKFGRRTTLKCTALPFIIGAIFVITATKAWMLCVGRFMWGLACGMNQTVVMIYIVEIASKEIRGKLTAGNRFIFNFAAFLTIAAGSFISYKTLSSFLIVVPVCYFIASWFIPDTPYFLLKVGKVDEAGEALMKLNGYKDKKVLDEKLTEMHADVREEMQRSGGIKELLTGKQYRRALVIAFGLAAARLLNGSFALKQYVGRILQETHTDVSVTGGLIVFGVVTLVTSMVASFLVDKVGRRPLLILSFVGTTIILAILGGCFYMVEVLNITIPYFGYINLISNSLLCIISTLGYDTVGFIIPAEIFPLNVKSTAITYLSIFGYAVNFIAMRGYQMILNFSGLYGAFWIFGFASFIGTVFTIVAIPETKGKSLREIQQELQGDLFNVTNNEDLTEVKEQKTDEIEDEPELQPLKTRL